MNEKKNIATEVQDELNELSPTLAKITKKNPYTVPEGYFKSAQDHAANMAMEMGIQKTPVLSRVYIRYAAIAASITILALFAWMKFLPGDHQQMAANEVTVDEMIEYLESESSFGIEEEELIEELIELEAVDPIEEDLNEGIDQTEVEAVATEDIIEYLLEDDIDLATIIDELN